MIKSIIMNLPVGSGNTATSGYAISVAREFGAHLTGIAFAYLPVLPGTIFGGMQAELIDAALVELVKSARSAVAGFEESARRAGPSAETRVLEASQAEGAGHFSRLARCFDLAIVGQPEPGKHSPDAPILEAALFESGRPLLVVPYIQQQPLKLDRILVCWDGSRNAARAFADALPFLTRGKSVEVVVVEGEGGKTDQIAGADIAHHLARHGLKVDVKRLVKGDVSIGNVILSHAADAGADMIVMGGYGHSRLRELVLGGATREILQSMTVPTLMSH